jgi:predicted  nucleic acid-binding Zn-ribbon protein
MNVTLRKANAIQASINETLKGLEFTDTVSINEFQNVGEAFEAASTKFVANVARRIDLTDALYEIRKAVGSANFQANVDSRLAEVARLEKDIQFFTKYATAKVRETDTVINGKLDKIRNRKEEAYYGRNEEVSTSIFTAEQVDNFKRVLADAKKRKQKLQDELLEANGRTEIALSEQTVATLTKENIL